MPYSHAYDVSSFHPPAPVVEVTISTPGESLITSKTILGLVDSGADITVIPQNLIRELGLASVGETEVIGFNEAKQVQSVYSASISIPSLEERVVRVIDTKGDYGLIGRDMINRWRVVLKGRERIVEIG